MTLSSVLDAAKSIEALNVIFDHNVTVELGWMNDAVTIGGYKGTVTTDFIAKKVLPIAIQAEESDDSKRLAKSLAEKVFAPLQSLVESPANRHALYQLAALTRVTWTPPQAPVFGSSVALKHAMVLGLLDRAQYFTG